MTVLSSRRAVVYAGDLQLEGFRISFKVKKTSDEKPNTAEVKVTGLSADSRGRAYKMKGQRLTLVAGYGEDAAVIFVGDIRFIESKRENADWVTKFEAGDGERNVQHARASQSFKGGTKATDIAKSLIGKMKLNPGTAMDVLKGKAGADKLFTGGFTAHGSAAKNLSKVLKPLGLEWSIQDGKLQLLPIRGVTAETAVLLSPDTGLVGSPEQSTPEKSSKNQAAEIDDELADEFESGAAESKPAYLKIRSLLQPSIRPGRQILLQSEARNGYFRCVNVDHSGDTDGQDWYSDAETLP